MATFNNLLLLITFLFCSSMAVGQDSISNRKYQFGIYNEYDLRNSSLNAISVHRVLQDGFRKLIKPKMNERIGGFSYGLFSFGNTYLSMLWSHEFGHSLRAKQVGGQFKIHNVSLPIPYTTMHLPETIDLTNESISVTAGFEVNSLTIRSIQNDFVVGNGLANEDLGLVFANRLMYPLYSLVIIPRNPEERQVWIDTAGDPVHISLAVFKNFADGQVFLADSVVNPDLVSFYRQSTLFGVLFNLLDPQVFREFGATFGKDKSRTPIFIIGNYDLGWTYGTLFNLSPLGYELYFNNYIHLFENKFSLYLKYGSPYKNQGLGMLWNDIMITPNLTVSSKLELWDQDIFGKGVSFESIFNYKISQRIGIFTNLGYKTKGYVLGKQLSQGFNLGSGFSIYTLH